LQDFPLPSLRSSEWNESSNLTQRRTEYKNSIKFIHSTIFDINFITGQAMYLCNKVLLNIYIIVSNTLYGDKKM